MNKTSNDSTTVSLHQTFWRWFSFSVLAMIVAAAIPALSADVFIDEGDGDFAPTPVSSPTAPSVADPHVGGGKAPASTSDVPPAAPGSDIDSAIGSLEPAHDAAPSEPMADTSAPVPAEIMPLGAPTEAPKAEAKKPKKKHLQAVKTSKPKKEKKSEKKTASKKKKDKKEKKTASVKAKKSKKKSLSDSSKASKRGVASVKYAGGQYATTSKSCSMESAPGAGDAVGTTVSGRKLWVEESGNTSYWKVYGKSGSAAFVSRDCF